MEYVKHNRGEDLTYVAGSRGEKMRILERRTMIEVSKSLPGKSRRPVIDRVLSDLSVSE